MTFEELKKDPTFTNIDDFIRKHRILDNGMNLCYALNDDKEKIFSIIERCLNGAKLIYVYAFENPNKDYEYIGNIIEGSIYMQIFRRKNYGKTI